MLLLAFTVVFAISRWPGLMPPNFSPAYAIAFCAGLYLPGAMGWWGPLAIMSTTDIALHFLFYSNFPFPWGTELGYLGLIALGRLLGRKKPWWMLLGGGLMGAALFYLITNTQSWLYDPGYAKTFADWVRALTTGLPGYPSTWEFFRNTLMSGGLFTGLFVGAMKLNEAAEEKEAEDKEEAEEPQPAKEPEAEGEKA